nr:helix-turn-helix domain-containing protein [uncultured Oscillibacter sp.]
MKKRYTRLTLEERLKIKELLDAGSSLRNIARIMGYSPSTICYELKKRNQQGKYDPYFAQAVHEKLTETKGRQSMFLDKRMADYVSKAILEEQLSPERIVERLAEDVCGFLMVPQSPNTIYRAIDDNLIPGVTRESLLQRTSTVFKGGQVCIPSWVREELDIKDGDILRLEITEDGGILYKKAEK